MISYVSDSKLLRDTSTTLTHHKALTKLRENKSNQKALEAWWMY